MSLSKNKNDSVQGHNSEVLTVYTTQKWFEKWRKGDINSMGY